MGFCYGVNRALDYIQKAQGKIYTLGWLIHNEHVIRDLLQKGIQSIDRIEDLPPNATLAITAHGATKQLLQYLEEKKIAILDTTCPFVKKIHDIVSDHTKKGYQVFIYGDKDHSEVKGIASYAQNPIIIQSTEEAKNLGRFKNAILVAQTTQSVDAYAAIQKEIKKHSQNLKVFNTICHATSQRQQAAKTLAQSVDIMIVIGDKRSANTRRLVDLCRAFTKTLHIGSAADLDEKIYSHQKIGITAGASTPEWIIEEVLQKLKKPGKDFAESIKLYQAEVDKQLKVFFDKQIRSAPSKHIKFNLKKTAEFVLGGGKRIRPIAMISAYTALSATENIKPILVPALSMELLHASSLVFDDVMDEDDYRRKLPTLHRALRWETQEKTSPQPGKRHLFRNHNDRFGVSSALCNGNILLSLGAKCLHTSSASHERLNEVLRLYLEAHRLISIGQLMDLAMEHEKNATEKDYIQMVALKTAVLFSTSLKTGALLAEARPGQIETLGKFGREIGIAFQLLDDVLDISRQHSKGRELGSDLKQGKRTLLVIKALEFSDDREKAAVLKVLGKTDAAEKDIDKAIGALHSTGAVQYVIDLANNTQEKALPLLDEADISADGHTFFREFADYMTHRII